MRRNILMAVMALIWTVPVWGQELLPNTDLPKSNLSHPMTLPQYEALENSIPSDLLEEGNLEASEQWGALWRCDAWPSYLGPIRTYYWIHWNAQVALQRAMGLCTAQFGYTCVYQCRYGYFL